MAAGGLQGGLCEERLGLPRAGHSWFQPAPADPPQGMAEPCSHDSSASGKASVRKGKVLPGSEG